MRCHRSMILCGRCRVVVVIPRLLPPCAIAINVARTLLVRRKEGDVTRPMLPDEIFNFKMLDINQQINKNNSILVIKLQRRKEKKYEPFEPRGYEWNVVSGALVAACRK